MSIVNGHIATLKNTKIKLKESDIMLQRKTIENMIKKYNEENGVEIKLTTMEHFSMDDVLAIELNGVKSPMGKAHIAKNLWISFKEPKNKKEVLDYINCLMKKAS